MNQPENQDLDVDALMRQIRLEIASRTARAPGSRQGTSGTYRPRTADRDAFDGTDVTLPRLAESAPAISRKREYTLRDFLNYHDEDFVRNAYRGLLGREPDAEGARRFLAMLRTGDLAKVEILGRIRFSPEGRAAAVRVTGLLVPFTLRTLRRIPVLGHVLGVIQYILRLPIIVRNHERLEAVVFFQQLEMRRGINAIDAEIEAALRRLRDSTATSMDATSEKIVAHESATSASLDRVTERMESRIAEVAAKFDQSGAKADEPTTLDAAAGRVDAGLAAEGLRATLDQIRTNTVHEDDFNGFRLLAPGSIGLIMDIGANRGQSIASLKAIFPNAVIHAFEANPMFFAGLEELRRLFPQSLVVHRHGLGRTRSTVQFFIPWVGSTPYLEESSTRRDYFDKPWVVEKFRSRGELRFDEIQVEVRPGDEMELDPEIIKIDVEGAEHDVLVGLRETLQRARPTLLVENSDWGSVTAFLDNLDYVPFRWEGNAGRFVPFHGETTNTFYFHRSRPPGVAAQ
jgi:FkbM family methyltransferase